MEYTFVIYMSKMKLDTNMKNINGVFGTRHFVIHLPILFLLFAFR